VWRLVPDTMRRSLPILLLLATAIGVVYGQVTSFEFIGYDDDVYVTENPHLVDGVGWEDIPAAFEAGMLTANWHPVTMLSLTLDTALFGLDAPGAFHATNLLLHLLATGLLFGALRSMTAREVESGLVAAAFGLHPLHVESVAWIAERKDVLAGVFWWGTTWLWVRSVHGGGRAARWGAWLSFALGLMAKPLLVTLPFTLLLFDVWPLRRRLGKALLVEKVPLFVMTGVGIAMTLFAQSRAGAVAALEVVPVAARLANALVSYRVYLEQTVWPVGLGVYYPHPTAAGQAPHSDLAVWGSLALLTALSAAAVWAWRRDQRAVLVGWLFYLGALVPMIGLVQVGQAAHSDRYMYIPLVGLMLAIVFPLGAWCRSRGRSVARGAAATGVVICVVWAVLSHEQASRWQDTRVLFEHTLRHTERNAVAHYNLACWLQEQGEVESAQQHFAAAYAIDPRHAGAAVNLGLTRVLAGEPEAGIALIEAGLAIEPDHVRGNLNLAIALAQQRSYARAQASLKQVLAHAGPRDHEERLRAYGLVPELALLRGDVAAAVRGYEAALAYAPRDRGILQRAVRHFSGSADPALRRSAFALSQDLEPADGMDPVPLLRLRAHAALAAGDRGAALAALEAAIVATDMRDVATLRRLHAERAQLLAAP